MSRGEEKCEGLVVVSIAMVAVVFMVVSAIVFAVIAAITIPIAAIIAAIVVIAVAWFECLATISAPIIATVLAIKVAFGCHAPVVVITVGCLRAGSAREEKKPAQRRRSKRCLTKQRLPETMQLHTSSLGAFLVLVGVVCVLYMKHESGLNVAGH